MKRRRTDKKWLEGNGMDWKEEEEKALLLDIEYSIICIEAEVVFVWTLPSFMVELHIFRLFSYTV